MGAQSGKPKKEDTYLAGGSTIPGASPHVYKMKNQVALPAPKISNTASIFSTYKSPFSNLDRATVPARSQLINYGSMTYGSSCTSHDALSRRNFNSIGLNPLRTGHLAIEQPTRKDVRPDPPPSAYIYETFRKNFQDLSMNRDEFQRFDARVRDNTDKMQKRLHEEKVLAARLKREEQRSRLITQTEPEKQVPSVFSFMSIRPRLLSHKLLDAKYFSSDKFPPLSPEIMAVIDEAIKPYPADEALVELDGVQILRKDIQTLIGLNWLNDEIMNAYMNLLVLRGKEARRKSVYAFNTFFYPKLRGSGYSSIKRWTRKVDIFSHDFVLVPVHLGNHWCLAFIDFTKRTISYYDSMGGRSNGCCDILLEYLKQESLDKRKQDFGKEDWRTFDSLDIPRQNNCSDCGVFACTFAEYLTRPAKFNFTQDNMPYLRKKMIYEIIKKIII